MIYVDTDFLLALSKEDDWLKQRAEKLAKEHEGELVTGLATFIELFLVAKRYDLDRSRMAADLLQLVDINFQEDLIFQADQLIEQGFTTFDAFHASHALLNDETMLSSDQAYDALPLDRINLEP